MEINGGGSTPTRYVQHGGNSVLRMPRGAVGRYIGRVRRRWRGAQIPPIPEDGGPLALSGGAAPEISSDAEWVPDLPPGAISLHPPFGFIESPRESAPDWGADTPSANVRTPRRSGGELGAPSPQGVRTESREVRVAGDAAFRARSLPVAWDRGNLFTIDGDGIQHAMRSPAGGLAGARVYFSNGGARSSLGPSYFQRSDCAMSACGT